MSLLLTYMEYLPDTFSRIREFILSLLNCFNHIPSIVSVITDIKDRIDELSHVKLLRGYRLLSHLSFFTPSEHVFLSWPNVRNRISLVRCWERCRFVSRELQWRVHSRKNKRKRYRNGWIISIANEPVAMTSIFPESDQIWKSWVLQFDRPPSILCQTLSRTTSYWLSAFSCLLLFLYESVCLQQENGADHSDSIN